MIPQLNKISSIEEAQKVIEAARSDLDAIIAPTHWVEKNGEIAGAWSINAIPLVLCWHHSKAMGARDSFVMRNTVDALLQDRGVPNYATCCRSDSPYIEHMEKFGYQPIWPTNMFLKNVRA